jgi:hypothetical protein
MTAKKYHSGKDFRQALEARLLAQAKSDRVPLERLRQEVAFDRFLARLLNNPDPDYLLKGGYAMELRLRHRARFSRDLDIAAKHQKETTGPDAMLRKLESELAVDMGDWFSFRLSESSMTLEGAPYAGYRFPVDARLAERTFARFHVDVAVGDPVLDDPSWLSGSSLLSFAGIPALKIPTLPAETHFAEKIHAYTRPRKTGPNSRVRDLVDMILLLDQGLLNPESVRRALKATFMRRDSHPLPDVLPQPHAAWTETYADLAAEIGLRTSPTCEAAFQRLSTYWKELFPK